MVFSIRQAICKSFELYIDGCISARRWAGRENRFFRAQYIGGSYLEGREYRQDMQVFYNFKMIKRGEEPVIYERKDGA